MGVGLFSSQSVVPVTPAHTNRQQFTMLPQTEDQRLPFTCKRSNKIIVIHISMHVCVYNVYFIDVLIIVILSLSYTCM